MAKNQEEQPLLPSVFDRLMDDEPENSQESPRSAIQTMRDIRVSVRRDLENLLNTRWRVSAWPLDYEQLNRSLVNYGIPDFSSIDMSSDMDRDSLRVAVEEAIRIYEPRFVSVKVELIENDDSADRTLRFLIHAELHATPNPEPIVFDSRVEAGDQLFKVRRKDR
ncbi:MAG: type VI secretion system baseplate subunit TssE [Blastopirellula sp.]|nr:MAG: type VI secretion system baseplate subunit TssE [Blastopirellula sp.]